MAAPLDEGFRTQPTLGATGPESPGSCNSLMLPDPSGSWERKRMSISYPVPEHQLVSGGELGPGAGLSGGSPPSLSLDQHLLAGLLHSPQCTLYFSHRKGAKYLKSKSRCTTRTWGSWWSRRPWGSHDPGRANLSIFPWRSR